LQPFQGYLWLGFESGLLGNATFLPSLSVVAVSLKKKVWFRSMAPLAGVLFLALALWVWRFGLRHYDSTGS
jgi:ABC-type uncharacterized transport system permease subunit